MNKYIFKVTMETKGKQEIKYMLGQGKGIKQAQKEIEQHIERNYPKVELYTVKLERN